MVELVVTKDKQEAIRKLFDVLSEDTSLGEDIWLILEDISYNTRHAEELGYMVSIVDE